ncbi:MAG: hypothetical protein AVDCRST_MAG32-966, partial [uncultured Nocardioides sp.]
DERAHLLRRWPDELPGALQLDEPVDLRPHHPARPDHADPAVRLRRTRGRGGRRRVLHHRQRAQLRSDPRHVRDDVHHRGRAPGPDPGAGPDQPGPEGPALPGTRHAGDPQRVGHGDDRHRLGGVGARRGHPCELVAADRPGRGGGLPRHRGHRPGDGRDQPGLAGRGDAGQRRLPRAADLHRHQRVGGRPAGVDGGGRSLPAPHPRHRGDPGRRGRCHLERRLGAGRHRAADRGGLRRAGAAGAALAGAPEPDPRHARADL